MPIVDVNLFVGECPFRDVPSSVEDLEALREGMGMDRAIATGYRSWLYFDPLSGLRRDLKEFEALSDWLSFYAVVNPEFPQLEEQVGLAVEEEQVVGVRLLPALHRFELCTDRTLEAVRLASTNGLPVNVAARVFDGRVAPRSIVQTDVDKGDLTAFLEQTKGTPVILSMFYFGDLSTLQVDWGQLDHVYLDLGCSKPSSVAFDSLASWFPVERVLFGTGAPYYYWGGDRLSLEASRLTPGEQAAILGGNATEVFQWG